MRFLAFLAGSAALAPPPHWTLLHRGSGLSLWSPTKHPGGPLDGGYWIGALATPPHVWSDLAGGCGSCVAFAQTPSGVRVFRDPSGAIPLYVAATAAGRVLCSHVEDVLRLLGRSPALDWTHLTALLLGDANPGRRTGFADVREILPGETVTFEGGVEHSERSWRPGRFWSAPFRSVPEAREALQGCAGEHRLLGDALPAGDDRPLGRPRFLGGPRLARPRRSTA